MGSRHRPCLSSISAAALAAFSGAPAFGQMMGGMMGHGGGMCRMMDVTPHPVDPASLPQPNSSGAQILQSKCVAMAPSVLPGGGQPGAKAFTRVCSQCRALPDPSAHTPEEWKTVVDRMAANMRNMGYGTLAPEQKRAILGYLEKNALK